MPQGVACELKKKKRQEMTHKDQQFFIRLSLSTSQRESTKHEGGEAKVKAQLSLPGEKLKIINYKSSETGTKRTCLTVCRASGIMFDGSSV